MNSHSAICGHCLTNLEPKEIIENNKHIYNIGTIYSCSCGKSRVWTNSIRNENDLIKFLEGKSDRYYQGFCNDKFCGYCFSNLYPLKTGYQIKGMEQSFDRWGCKYHKQNQNIAMDGWKEDRENETNNMMDWYNNNIEKIKSFMDLEKIASPIADRDDKKTYFDYGHGDDDMTKENPIYLWWINSNWDFHDLKMDYGYTSHNDVLKYDRSGFKTIAVGRYDPKKRICSMAINWNNLTMEMTSLKEMREKFIIKKVEQMLDEMYDNPTILQFD